MPKQLRDLKHQLLRKFIEGKGTLQQAKSDDEEDEQEELSSNPNVVNSSTLPPTRHTLGGNPFTFT